MYVDWEPPARRQRGTTCRRSERSYRPSAQPLIDALPAALACDCAICSAHVVNERPVVGGLSVQRLKTHFLLCRGRELDDAQADLGGELDAITQVADWLDSHRLPRVVPQDAGTRLRTWRKRFDGSSEIGS
jgi:hypothetical protein